jgi:hypothetical protein
MISYTSPGQRYSGGFVATAESKRDGVKAKGYVERMRELTTSVAKRNKRIESLKKQVSPPARSK